ncbi:hypothetical protein DFQ01_12624 [Paenibacillus cellulosilyticus]|uniref:Uncharacterized protein n=1 Tax=Paenibacillus cellulosilyticus TaxID=375489 RepID=A0A2V2YMS8_9BACL|nr:hypothetical protein [Paenibacillus cellulosilyticus]PWV95553.1 hypothetical protein DFQ01_12624 [Paenibacillus cellulosilyticus]QKS47368.1 hypothetical protein HUB94_23505 [Paenibacillus cellulosilyticus]
MMERLTNLEQRLTEQHHKDLFLHTKHTIRAIDDLAEQHRLLTAAHAINGYKIIGSEEVLFYDTLAQAKEQIVLTLEKTLDDLEHKGDKNYDRNFADGVE